MAHWSALFSPRPKTPPPQRPSLTLYSLLAGAFLLTLVPHVVQFPLWLTIGVLVAMGLRSVLEVYRLPLPSLTFCSIMAVILLGAIWWQFQRVTGRDAGTAFTAGLLTIKFYELRGPRDVVLVIFSCFFVVMSALLYSQVLELFIYCLIMMWVLTALLLRVHTGDLPQDRLLRMLRKSSIIFLQALPLTLFLFFFFPRYTGPLSIPLDESSTGLTDTVAPGSIARLAQNDTEAMYAQIKSGSAPMTGAMYWRALVLWDYRDGIWTPGEMAGLPERKPAVSAESDRILQEITVRSHNQRWLFALDVPVSAPVNSAELPGWASLFCGDVVQLRNGTKLNHKARYTVVSAGIRADEELSDGERVVGTRLDHIDPKVVDLANRLHQGLSDGQEQEYINAVLQYFRHGGFVYSTTPGVQGPDWLPVFLFKTKKGFCEHFASAFALLMRQEKIPARLVVGYQGGEYNPYADHYIVNQSNAHAWDEVWIRAKNQPPAGRRGHWARVDPTARIAMADEGFSSSRATDAADTLSSQVAHRPLSLAQTYLPGWIQDALKEVQLRREQVETGWDNLVFSYDPEAQNRLAQAIGLGTQARFELLLGCLFAGGIGFVIFRRWMMRKPPISPVENLYASFCRNMAQRGVPRASWEGPLGYTERVAEAFPGDKPAIQRVGSIVAQVRYGPAPASPDSAHDLKSLLTLITASQAAAISREQR